MDIQLPKNIHPPTVKSLTSGMRGRGPWIETSLLAIIILIAYFFIVAPKRTAVTAQQGQLDILQQKADDTSKKLETLKLMAQELQNHKSDVVNLDEALPLSGSTIELQMLLESMSQTAALTINDINVVSGGDPVVAGNKVLLSDPYAVKRSLQKLQATVSVSGTFDNLLSFMQKIEGSGRILDVTSFDISPSKDSQLELRLYINAYYYAS